MKTVLVGPEALASDRLEIEGETYRHLFRASRLAVGDAVRLVDGQGNARRGLIREVTRHQAVVSVGGKLPDGEPRRRVELWAPMPRPSRASWMVEKLTEVGAAGIHFYLSQRAPRRSGASQIRRLERVAAGALQQCGRSRLPTLTGDHAWSAMLASLGEPGTRCLVLDPSAPAGRPTLGPDADRVALLVGPEGGWTEDETADLRATGGQGVRLGPTVLRVETAAVVGVAMVVCSE